MPYSLELPAPLKKQGWKVKIRDKERVEPPHATVIRRTQSWRIGLRHVVFLDDSPDPTFVPRAVLDVVEYNLEVLRVEWDKKYPHNPVSSHE